LTKVLILSNGITPDHLGGLQRYVRELAGSLSLRDAQVTVVARRLDASLPLEETADDGVRIVRFDGPSKTSRLYAAKYPIVAAAAAERAVRRYSDHLLHSHFALQAIPLAVGRRPFVHTFHAPVYREIASERQGSYALTPALERGLVAASRRVEAGMLRRSRTIIALSDFMRREIGVLDAAAAHRTVLVPGGIDVKRFSPGPPIDHPWARAEDGFLLFTARRLVPRTGVGELVGAMPQILERVPNARLVIAGQGGLRDRIAAEIAERGLADHVLLAGRVSEDDLVGWYRAADLTVIPTQELEGFGLTTAEALACGTPAVGTPAGATPEILATLDPRLVSRGITTADIADAVIDIASDPAMLARVAGQVRDRVARTMSWDAIADRHLELYAEAAATQ
jgi:glycosyltransferase involved in cell wall biosynthesis